MTNINVNKLSLLTNLFSIVAGVGAYSIMASSSETASTIVFTLATLLASFIGSRFVSNQLQDNSTTFSAKENAPLSVIRIITLLPLVLCIYEVVALLWLGASPSSVGWAHIAAASTAGYNAEALYRDHGVN